MKNLTFLREEDFLMVFDIDFTLYSEHDIEVRVYEIFNKFRIYIESLNTECVACERLNVFVELDESDYYILNKKELARWNEWNKIEDSMKIILLSLNFGIKAKDLDLASFLRPKEELFAILHSLKNTSEKKYRFIVLTDTPEEEARRVLVKLGIESMFEAVFCYDRTTDRSGILSKKNFESFKFVEKSYGLDYLLKNTPVYFHVQKNKIKFDIPSKNILFFDDQVVNIQTAREYGWNGVLVSPDDIITDVIMLFAFEYSDSEKILVDIVENLDSLQKK